MVRLQRTKWRRFRRRGTLILGGAFLILYITMVWHANLNHSQGFNVQTFKWGQTMPIDIGTLEMVEYYKPDGSDFDEANQRYVHKGRLTLRLTNTSQEAVDLLPMASSRFVPPNDFATFADELFVDGEEVVQPGNKMVLPGNTVDVTLTFSYLTEREEAVDGTGWQFVPTNHFFKAAYMKQWRDKRLHYAPVFMLDE